MRTSGLILHDESAVCAPSARPGGLANADGVPERGHIDKSRSPGKAKSAALRAAPEPDRAAAGDHRRNPPFTQFRKWQPAPKRARKGEGRFNRFPLASAQGTEGSTP